MPKIGYGSDKKTKFLRPDGFKTFVVSNPADLQVILFLFFFFSSKKKISKKYKFNLELIINVIGENVQEYNEK